MESMTIFNHDEIQNDGICKCMNVKLTTIPILMHQMRISTNQVSSVMLKLKKLEIKKNGQNCKLNSVLKLGQIRRRIELCMMEIILRFEINLSYIQFIFEFLSKYRST
jgi:hypothetical protein